ncbi:hypothetical protein HKX48_007695 [Thoreauomyces humboldtii]|nr:hypothetical protein HKX48_007695 [Thoreauomyces humboldtii]
MQEQGEWRTVINPSRRQIAGGSNAVLVTEDSLLCAQINSSVELGKYLDYSTRSAYLKSKCVGMGVPEEIYDTGMTKFKEALLEGKLEGLTIGNAIAHVRARTKADRFILPPFYKFMAVTYPDETETLVSLMSFSDLTKPAEWHAGARSMQRKIIMHLGPTNSGKTYAALKRLEECKTGIYCGPLRLLAHEVYERMNAKGIPCNLLTGEERRESDGVNKYAATVEMAPLSKRFEVAVLDEIQMIGDSGRGWAWTQGVLGIQADEIHLCGEPTIIPLIMAMVKETGDIVEIKRYERLTKLTVAETGLGGNLSELRRGDCIVTFSRQNIFALKRSIEQKTKLRAAVIYGSLPPETRTEQARQFNDPNGPYDVLVASDAIGMGLNLNIGRMIFERVEKWDGQNTKPLSISQVKQIGGRAGRFGTEFDKGEVCTLDDYDMEPMKSLFNAEAPSVLSAGLFPSLEQIEMFSQYLPGETLSTLLDRFQDLANLDGRYFLCNLNTQREVADLIEDYPLTLRDRYTFILAPCKPKDAIAAAQLRRFASAHSEGDECSLEDSIVLGDHPPANIDALKNLEAQHGVIILYMWLSQRFPETFTDIDNAHHLKRSCETLIDRGLAELKFERKKKVTGMGKKIAREIAKEAREQAQLAGIDESATVERSLEGGLDVPVAQGVEVEVKPIETVVVSPTATVEAEDRY